VSIFVHRGDITMWKTLKILLAVGLFLAVMPLSASAGKGSGVVRPIKPKTDWVGWTASDPLIIGDASIPGPNSSSVAMPGGGSAWAQAYLGWTSLRMDADAVTGLDHVTRSFYVAARVVQVKKNGQPMGGSRGLGTWSTTGVHDGLSIYFGAVYGFKWENSTSHLVTDYGQFSWGPTAYVSVTP
jgi:hypothetical protein